MGTWVMAEPRSRTRTASTSPTSATSTGPTRCRARCSRLHRAGARPEHLPRRSSRRPRRRAGPSDALCPVRSLPSVAMLFSSPDYPLFLIAVFFLYALARVGRRARVAWARIALMVLLGDVVFMLVAKDPGRAVGSARRRAATGSPRTIDPQCRDWPLGCSCDWVIGAAVLRRGDRGGRARGAWIASARGQRWVARGLVTAVLATLAATVRARVVGRACSTDVSRRRSRRDAHLLVLVVLGVGIGAVAGRVAPHARARGRAVRRVERCSTTRGRPRCRGRIATCSRCCSAPSSSTTTSAIWIERTEAPAARKALVIVSLCSNLGILCVLQVHRLLHARRAAPRRRASAHLILPAGISFHTFQSLSYTIDVYRKQLRATRSPIQFATFVLFFPQLVAGPIVRAQDLLPQLAELAGAGAREGDATACYRIIVGLFKKIALADTLALTIVDRVFETPAHFSSLEVARRRRRLRVPDLPRLLGVLRHRDRLGAGARASTCRRTSGPRIAARTSRSSGGAGTSACRRGCATTSTSRSAAAAVRRGARTST